MSPSGTDARQAGTPAQPGGSSRPTKLVDRRGAVAERVEAFCARLPLLIVAYFAFQGGLRFLISANLEIDEAEVASRAGFLLGYDNSHPPLYEWLAFSLQRVFGSWALTFAILKNALLALAFLLTHRCGRALFGTHTGGALLALSLCFMPEIVWQSQVSLAHSVLALTASAGFLAAIVLLTERITWLRVFGFAVTVAAMLLSKYNTILLAAGLTVAVFWHPATRGRLADWRVAAAAGIGLAAAAPHYLWALANLDQSTGRLARVTTPHPLWSRFDFPVIGVDGLLSLGSALVTSAGPLAILWLIGDRISRAEAGPDERLSDLARAWRTVSGTALLLCLGAVAAGLFLLDLRHLHDRYLTPALLLLPVWLALSFPMALRPRAARRTAALALAIAVAVAIALPSLYLFGRHALAFPYDRLAAQLSGRVGADVAVASPRHDDAVNLALRLNGGHLIDPSAPPERIAMLWRAGQPAPAMPDASTGCYVQIGKAESVSAPFHFLSRHVAEFRFALLQRVPKTADAPCPDSGVR